MRKNKITKENIIAAANQIVRFYSANFIPDPTTQVRKGKFKHLDPSLPDDEGFWVNCKLFVPLNHFEEKNDL